MSGGIGMEKIDNIITKLLLLDGNESNLLDDIDDYKNFRRLIIELVKIKYDIRWCSNDNCKCHPETTIRTILENNFELHSFLDKFIKLDEVKSMINVYENITVWDKGYVK